MGWKRTDDLSGAEAEQRTFGLDGQAYSIDLGPENWERLQAALQPFLTVATAYGPLPVAPEGPSGREQQQLVKVKVTAASARNGARSNGSNASATKRRAAKNQAPLSEVRAWAKTAGHDVPDKGRISDHILDLYDEAHGSSRP